MSIKQLRLIDIKEHDEELSVQEVLDAKVAVAAPAKPVYRGDVPDIKTKEEEEHWQGVIDARTAKIKGLAEPVVEETPKDLDVTLPVLEPTEPVPPTEAPVQSEPEPTPPVVEEAPKEPEPVQEPEIVEPTVKKFCEFCDSKGGRHKKECPTLKSS